MENLVVFKPLLFLAFFCLLPGCALHDGLFNDAVNEPNQDAGTDAELDDANDGERNPCGGLSDLTYEGAFAEPGAECGDCGGGLLVCQSEEALRCAGPRVTNECGGCTNLSDRPGDSCGQCDSGQWECSDSESIECVDQADANDCGGCATLPGQQFYPCDLDGGGEGLWRCQGPDEMGCIGGGNNACGGTQELDDEPGTPCGTCQGGTWACSGINAVTCHQSDMGTNACGGCEPLEAAPGSPCGRCEGQWTCDGHDEVRCDDDPPNACGGCIDLPDDPGDSCGDGAIFTCDDASLLCSNTATNACGGTQTLSHLPGEPCGDGLYVCATPEETICLELDSGDP